MNSWGVLDAKFKLLVRWPYPMNFVSQGFFALRDHRCCILSICSYVSGGCVFVQVEFVLQGLSSWVRWLWERSNRDGIQMKCLEQHHRYALSQRALWTDASSKRYSTFFTLFLVPFQIPRPNFPSCAMENDVVRNPSFERRPLVPSHTTWESLPFCRSLCTLAP